MIISQSVGGSNNAFYVRWAYNNNTIQCFSQSGPFLITSAVSQDEWVNIITTNDVSGNAATVFIDGVEDTSGTAWGKTQTFDDKLIVGEANFAATASDFDGDIANVTIYDTILSDNEILALSKGVNPTQIRRNNIVGYWPLHGILSPEGDLSGNGNTGTLTNTTRASHTPTRLLRRF